tara:strand:- start:180 stop:332 length:153 start_codon:yes stop_codon:yes gene_type:complete
MEHIKDILNKIKTWWKDFKKNHIIDEVPPNEPFFRDEFGESDQDNQPFGD